MPLFTRILSNNSTSLTKTFSHDKPKYNLGYHTAKWNNPLLHELLEKSYQNYKEGNHPNLKIEEMRERISEQIREKFTKEIEAVAS